MELSPTDPSPCSKYPGHWPCFKVKAPSTLRNFPKLHIFSPISPDPIKYPNLRVPPGTRGHLYSRSQQESVLIETAQPGSPCLLPSVHDAPSSYSVQTTGVVPTRSFWVQTMPPTVQSLRAEEDCCDYHAVLAVADSSNPQRFPPRGFRPDKPHPLLKAKRRDPGQRLFQSWGPP